eukprot:PhM_4_TR11583/c0_g1_i1/m.81968/K14792/RRP5, PDCD11; rRNA biogenesis protein RRP5
MIDLDQSRFLSDVARAIENGRETDSCLLVDGAQAESALRSGIVLRLPHNVTALLPTSMMTGHNDEWSQALSKHFASNFGALSFPVRVTKVDFSAKKDYAVTVSAQYRDVAAESTKLLGRDVESLANFMFDRLKVVTTTQAEGIGEAAKLVGRVVPANVVSVTKLGAVVSLPGSIHGVALTPSLSLDAGSDVVCRILDFDVKTSMVDVSVDPEVVQTMPVDVVASFDPNVSVTCTVLVAKPTYTVLSVSVPNSDKTVIAYAPVSQSTKVASKDATATAKSRHKKGDVFQGYVVHTPSNVLPNYLVSHHKIQATAGSDGPIATAVRIGSLPFPWKLTTDNDKKKLCDDLYYYGTRSHFGHGDDDRHEDDADEAEREARRKTARKKLKEDAIDVVERARVSSTGAAFPTPQSEEDFEKMLLANPQSSFLWTQYMAFYVSRGQTEQTRKVAERGLRMINAREASERENVWIAYLNVEYQCGTKESLEVVFRRAVQHSDHPCQIYLKLLNIYESNNDNQASFLLLRQMLIKFKDNVEVWVRYAKNLIKFHKNDALKAMLRDVLVALPNKVDHSQVLVRTAVAMYDGEMVTQARALFESLLTKYPGKLDIWGVYLDKELSLLKKAVAGSSSTAATSVSASTTHTRGVYNRLTSLPLNAKTMQRYLTQFMEFEKAHGDEASIAVVKARAQAYVEQKLSK